jgi:hypothetical protein
VGFGDVSIGSKAMPKMLLKDGVEVETAVVVTELTI